jgi:hypothetical protein
VKRGGEGAQPRRWRGSVAAGAINASGSVEAVTGGERKGEAVGKCGGSIYGVVEEAEGRGEAGGCAGKRGEGGGRRLKKPDVWAPHVSE